MQQVIYLNYEFGIRKNYFLCKSCSGVGKGDSALFEPKHTIHLLSWINALALLGRPWELDPSWAEACRSWAPDLPLAPHLGVLLSAGCSLPKKTPIRKEPTWLSRASVTAPFNTLSLNISVLIWFCFAPYFPPPSLCKYKRSCSHLPTKAMTKSIWAAVLSSGLFWSPVFTDKLGDAHTQ